MKLSQDAIESRLAHWPVARLATVGADGRPHQVPIVFARTGECLWSPVDGKPKSGRELARVRNVQEHPDVSLLLDEYNDDWTRLWWIRIDATARVVHQGPDILAALDALQAKYPQYQETPILQDPPTLLAFAPTRIRSWCAGPLAP